MPTEEMSDEELDARCAQAIKLGWSRDKFYTRLIAERKRVGGERVKRVWEAHNGPVQPRRQ